MHRHRQMHRNGCTMLQWCSHVLQHGTSWPKNSINFPVYLHDGRLPQGPRSELRSSLIRPSFILLEASELCLNEPFPSAHWSTQAKRRPMPRISDLRDEHKPHIPYADQTLRKQYYPSVYTGCGMWGSYSSRRSEIMGMGLVVGYMQQLVEDSADCSRRPCKCIGWHGSPSRRDHWEAPEQGWQCAHAAGCHGTAAQHHPRPAHSAAACLQRHPSGPPPASHRAAPAPALGKCPASAC